jgi:hypothetical protein
MSDKALTFGEKAVGLTFNPSNDPVVQDIKKHYAAIIDLLHEQHVTAVSGVQARHYAVAITDTETAQMRAVKAATWKE